MISVLEAVVDAAVARGEDVRLSTDNAGCVPLIGGTYQRGAEMAEKPLLQQRLPSAPAAAAYGEQCADTDGLAKYLVADGHEDDQPRRMPSDVAAALDTSTDVLVSDETWNGVKALVLARDDRIAELQARIARKEAANEALVAKLEATLVDMQSLQRKAADWEAECRRLAALLIETQQQLARRMALPANALKHTKGLR